MKVRDGWAGNGKRKYIEAESGVEHNPDPKTERGIARRKAKYPNGIDVSHPAWKPGGMLCKGKPNGGKKKEE